jgi:SAM-dependent methyltransferase
VVISGQALEHIEFFWLTMLEISRILKPGGLCCLIAPSAGPEHRFPVDCWRFYRDGMAALGKWAGFEILASETGDAVAENTFSDDSELWRDSMLVARQPAKTLARRWREWRRRQSLKMVAVASADRE